MENILTDEEKKRIWEDGYKKHVDESIKKLWKEEEREWQQPIRESVRDAVFKLPLGDLFYKKDIVKIVNDVWDKKHIELVKHELQKALSDDAGVLRKSIADILSAQILESCFEMKEKKELTQKYKDKILPKLKKALTSNEMDDFIEAVVSKKFASFKVDLLQEIDHATSQASFKIMQDLCEKASKEYIKLVGFMQ